VETAVEKMAGQGSAEFLTAISLDFKTRKRVEKNLRLHTVFS
jgi:hypothetical protein